MLGVMLIPKLAFIGCKRFLSLGAGDAFLTGESGLGDGVLVFKGLDISGSTTECSNASLIVVESTDLFWFSVLLVVLLLMNHLYTLSSSFA